MASLETAMPADPGDLETVNLWSDAWQRLVANRLALAGVVAIVFLVFVAAFGPWLAPYDFLDQDLAIRNQSPSAAHWFGTDDLGRDLMSRVIYGTRTAFIIALAVTGMAAFVGITLGALAGYFRGRVESVIMWATDVTLSIPQLLLVVALTTSLKPLISGWMGEMYLVTFNPIFRQTILIDLLLVFGTMSFVLWPPYARLVRGQVISIRSRNYVTAARALGLPTSTIIWRYIVPNAIGPVIVAVSGGLGTAMVLESGFSFLGIGVRPPLPSWGNMISDGLRVWRTYPHLLVAPAAVLGIATIAFNLIGDGLTDALDPRQWRKRR